jgi:WS/DGAT/MGAT family acyltransferase
MKRLTGLDAGFLALETPSCPMHVAGLAVYDPSEVPGGWTVDTLVGVIAQRLHLAPPFRQRLVEVPFGLHHPLWIEDPDFHLDHHVHHVAVPPPGTLRELAALASHLVALPLDRRRPLWEMWVVEGLEHGHVAVLSKVHHAAIDGASGAELTVALLDLSPEVAVHEPDAVWEPDRVPTDAELLTHAASSLARQPLAVARAARRTAEAGLGIRRRNRGEPTVPPAPFAAPRTSWTRALTRDRALACSTLPLAEIKAVKRAAGTTVNDVVLAVCAGALRRWLDERGEVPDAPLVAMVPISVRTDDGRGDMGNQVSSALASLATDVDDPLERLLTISSGMRAVKAQHQLIGATTLQDWAEFAAPAVAARAARLYSRFRVAGRHRPLFNLTISNVPGPPFPLYLGGARLVSNFPIGPIFDGAGLNITVMGYRDALDVGINVCPDLLDDPWVLAADLRVALDELLGATGAEVADAPDEPAPTG